MARAVVFDLFHTLVDPEPLKPDGFDAVVEVATRLDIDGDAFRRFWVETELEQETTPIDLVDLVQRHVDTVDRTLTPNERLSVDAVFGVGKDEAILEPSQPLVDLVATLADRCPVGVLSNCEAREVRVWTESPLCAHVRAFVRSCQLGHMKPHPAMYAEVLRLLDVGAVDAVYVANGSSDELGGARRAGFGRIVHMNAFDRLHGLVSVADQRHRASQADISVNEIDDLARELLS